MFSINFGDFLFSSEDEEEAIDTWITDQYIEDAANETEESASRLAHEEDGSIEGSNDAPNKDEEQEEPENEELEPDHNTDINEYASVSTDLEKYNYDQMRWHGIPNLRKYCLSKQSDKGEGKRQKTDTPKKDEKSEVTVKPVTQDKPKALPTSGRKSKSQDEAPLGPAQEIPKDGEIHFDTRENMWYTYKKNDIYISERATFHHWIRADLTHSEDAKGSYAFPRNRGPGSFDTTCFNEVQEHWGLQRSHYAPVMFQWERLDRKDPTYQLDNLYHRGLLVIDYWLSPVRNFREIPLVISSAFEGGYMEPATRLHSEMAYEDIRARMPPFVEITKKEAKQAPKTRATSKPSDDRKRGVKRKGNDHEDEPLSNMNPRYKALSKASTFSGRSRHFREEAGAISWDKREGSGNIKSFIEKIVKPVNNSTLGSRDLTRDEIKRLRLMNHGTKPERAKPGTTMKSKERYIKYTRKDAGLHPTTDPTTDPMTNPTTDPTTDHTTDSTTDPKTDPCQNVKNDNEGQDMTYKDEYDLLYEDPEDQPLPSIEENNHEDEHVVADSSDTTAPPRFVFGLIKPPFLKAMTEDEARMHPTVDVSDPRNHIPKTSTEANAIMDALQVTIDHFKQIWKVEPKLFGGGNYISEYCNIQDEMDELSIVEAIALRRLGRWEGTIFDWKRAEVEDEPCIGRSRPWYQDS